MRVLGGEIPLWRQVAQLKGRLQCFFRSSREIYRGNRFNLAPVYHHKYSMNWIALIYFQIQKRI
jgi:hypothetical protein